MYYRLNEKYSLRGWEKLPFAILDNASGNVRFIKGREMEALELCDGVIDADSVFLSDELRSIIKAAEQKGIVNRCAAGERILPHQEYKKYPARYVKMAHWSMTGRCNYKCRHCYMSAPDAKFGELSHEQCLSIIDELAECGVMNMSLTGGEPLVRGDFWELADAMIEKGLHIRVIYSNGKLVTEEFLNRLEKRGLKPEINMSFDGVGHCDWLRGVKGAEKAVLDAFARCQKRGFRTAAELCLHKRNRGTLRESVNLLAELGCSNVKTNPVAPVGAWLNNAENNTLTMEETFETYLEYIPHYFEDGAPMDIMLGGFFSARKGSSKYIIPSKKYCGKACDEEKCVCGHARLVMYIAADGRVLPCMSLSGMDIQEKFPLVTEMGLKQCISDSSFMDMVNLRLGDLLEHNAECRECEYKWVCGGGCRAGALQNSDDFLAKDEAACLIFKRNYEEKITDALKSIEV